MAQRSTGVTAMLVAGMALGAWLCVRIIFESKHELPWVIAGVSSLILLAVCGWGLWGRNRWGLTFSYVLALGTLGFGGWGAHFAWTFWIVQEPTLADRIKSVLQPQISLLIVVPLVWLGYFTRPSVRAHFQTGR